MDKRKQINILLAKWNPLGVPEELTESEYTDYIDLILSNIYSKQELQICITKILSEYMGIVLTPNDIQEIGKICEEFMKVDCDSGCRDQETK